MTKNEVFKTCPCCFHTWSSREEFLSDPNLEIDGYQVNFKKLEHGLFLFTHKVAPCYSTMSIMVGEFQDLYTGKHYKGSKAFSEVCPRHCIDEKQLSGCDAFCECAFAREIIQIIIEKKEASND